MRKTSSESGAVHLLVVVLVLIALVVGVFFLLKRGNTVKKDGSPDSNVEVSLGDTFTLKEGQTATLSGTDISFRLDGFGYTPRLEQPPAPTTHTKILKGGKEIGSLYSSRPLDPLYLYLTLKDSDYDSYAKYYIDHIDKECSNRSSQRDSCWARLAERLKDASYCGKVDSLILKDNCLEELAELTNDSKLCGKVTDPDMYCKYLEVVEVGDLDLCDSVLTWRHSTACYLEIAREQGGIADCQELEPGETYVCEKAFEESMESYPPWLNDNK